MDPARAHPPPHPGGERTFAPSTATDGSSGSAPPRSLPVDSNDDARYGASDYTSDDPSTSQLPNGAMLPPDSLYSPQEAQNRKPRFGKWGRWIEGRAQDRRDEKAQLRAAGLEKSSGWSLPGQERGSSPLRRDPSALRRDEEAERTLSRDHLILVTTPDSTTPASSSPSRSASPTAATAAVAVRRRSRTSSSASVSAAVQPLTRHVRIERVGERFSTGLPEQPLCGCPLPIGPQASTARFTLIGTKQGLYVLDAQPNAGIAVSSGGDSTARHHAIWTGLAVHHIETYAETDPYAESPRGLVLALVDGINGDLELRMWNLASIVNLVKWRVYSATSVVLSLEPESPTQATHARTKSAFGVKSPTSPEKKSTTKRWSSASSRAGPAPPSDPHPNASPFRYPLSPYPTGGASDLEGCYDSYESPATPQSSASHLSLHGPGRARSASETSHLELPLEWATASVALPVPRSAGPILSFRLFRRPRPSRRRYFKADRTPAADNSDVSDDSDADEDDDGDGEDGPPDSRPPQMGSAAKPSSSRHHLYMFVATSRSIFLYESEPVERRTWHLAKEFFAPSTPRFMHLLRTGSPSGDATGATALPADISLLLGTSHHLVLIRLSDSIVSELKIPGIDPQIKRNQSLSTGGGAPSAVKRSQSQQHRKASPSFAASLRDLNAKMSRLIDGGDRALPAGLRGIDSDFVKSRVVSDDGHDDESSSTGLHGANAHHPKWIGCSEVTIPGRAAGSVQVLLLSNARASYLVALRRDQSAAEASPPVLLHTFPWAISASPLVHVVASVFPPSCGRASGRPSSSSSSAHLVLVGFTTTGLLISEHLLSSSAILSRVFADSSSAPTSSPSSDKPAPPKAAVVRSLPSRPPAHSLAPSATHHEDLDLSDRAAFDFGRPMGRVCPIANGLDIVEPSGGRLHDDTTQARQPQQRSEYFWVQGRAEWTLKRLVCEGIGAA
ncbi:hypothetical protein JCM10908_001669 [Rhodotorula pacifica]|uniref:uncharacterized protein n=1 Tax=Rhodotorula pacifica TaxID=1495444 RepID=UPI003181413E